MKQCQHCGSPYRPVSGRDGFCCAGCRHVYEMIRESGLGDYYARQDRAGQPVGDRPFSGLDSVAVKQLQKQVEGATDCHLTMSVRGMSCLGCAWLIEQLCRRQKGVRSARVALEANRLKISWKAGGFDLPAFAEELHRFGYGISPDTGGMVKKVSPLGLRLGLTLVFSFNGLLLLLAKEAAIGGGALQRLYDLLLLVCLLFAQLVGGALFLRPVWRGFLLRSFNSDAFPAFVLLGAFVWALGALLFSADWSWSVMIFFVLLPSMVFARWLSEMWHLKKVD